MSNQRLLLDTFTQFRRDHWQKSADRALNCDIRSLLFTTEDDIRIAILSDRWIRHPISTRLPGAPWSIIERISCGNPAKRLSTATKGGADGIELVFIDSAVSRGGGLDRIDRHLPALAGTNGCSVRIDGGERSLAFLGDCSDWAGCRDVTLAFDPVATLAARSGLQTSIETWMDRTRATAEAFDRSGIAGDVILADGRPWNDGGASEVQELSVILATFAAHLRAFNERGSLPVEAAPRIGIAMAATADTFTSIAKFRAVRQLIRRVLELMGDDTSRPRVHGESAWRMMAPHTPEMNILRGTTAALAMAAGGADSITVLPAHFEDDGFQDRMARNTQTILRFETGLARVADPAAGSGALEALTADLAQAAWTRFQEIEAKGGIVDAVTTGSIQAETARMRDVRRDRLARRDIEMMGVNVHVERRPIVAPSMETSPIPHGRFAVGPVDVLRATRLSHDYDRLRQRAAAMARDGWHLHVGVVAIGGNDSRHMAQAASDALAAAGIETVQADAAAPVSEAVAAFAAAPTAVACICAGSGITSEDLADLARRLAAAGAKHILACGVGHGAAPIDIRLTPFLEPGANLVEALSRILEAIAAGPKTCDLKP